MLLYRQGLYVVGALLSDRKAATVADNWREHLGVFAVERFIEVDALRDAFDVPHDFHLDEVLHGAFGIHVKPEHETMRVVIEFSKEKAALVRARVWHPTQEVEELSNGRLRFSFECTNMTPVVSWVLEWGPHARAVEPPQLRMRVMRELDQARAQY